MFGVLCNHLPWLSVLQGISFIGISWDQGTSAIFKYGHPCGHMQRTVARDRANEELYLQRCNLRVSSSDIYGAFVWIGINIGILDSS
jgi:hypothetical protein